jgi:hypothetical protein
MFDFFLLDDFAEADADLLSFPVLLDFADSQENAALFLPPEPDRPLTKSEKEWVQEAQRNPDLVTSPPSAPALRQLQKHLEKYAGPMPATKEQWQNFVMTKYYELTLDPDPKVSKPALDALAKTNIVGLHTEVQEININTKSTVEIEADLLSLVQRLANKEPQPEEVLDGDFEEL